MWRRGCPCPCLSSRGRPGKQAPLIALAPRPPPPAPAAVARELTKRGWRRVFVVAGGCQSWTAAKLRIKPWRAAGLLMAPLEHKDEPVPLDVVA